MSSPFNHWRLSFSNWLCFTSKATHHNALPFFLLPPPILVLRWESLFLYPFSFSHSMPACPPDPCKPVSSSHSFPSQPQDALGLKLVLHLLWEIPWWWWSELTKNSYCDIPKLCWHHSFPWENLFSIFAFPQPKFTAKFRQSPLQRD